jgi:hypothetical protein
MHDIQVRIVLFSQKNEFFNNQMRICCMFFLVSSPDAKAQGELLVSKGNAPASVVMRQQSSSSADLLQIWSVASL